MTTAGPVERLATKLIFEPANTSVAEVLTEARQHDKRTAALVEAGERILRRLCKCGHAKEGRPESHYYGDRTMKTPCQHCDCQNYELDVREEVLAFIAFRTALAAFKEEA